MKCKEELLDELQAEKNKSARLRHLAANIQGTADRIRYYCALEEDLLDDIDRYDTLLLCPGLDPRVDLWRKALQGAKETLASIQKKIRQLKGDMDHGDTNELIQ